MCFAWTVHLQTEGQFALSLLTGNRAQVCQRVCLQWIIQPVLLPLNLGNNAAVKGFLSLAANAIVGLSLRLAWGLHYFTGDFDLVWQHHYKLVSFHLANQAQILSPACQYQTYKVANVVVEETENRAEGGEVLVSRCHLKHLPRVQPDGTFSSPSPSYHWPVVFVQGPLRGQMAPTSQTLDPLKISVGNMSPLFAFSDGCRTPSVRNAVSFLPVHPDPDTGRLHTKRSLQWVLRDSENKIAQDGKERDFCIDNMQMYANSIYKLNT